MSSGSSGRGRPSTGSESSQSRLNESISRFSPRISSTRSGHCVSEAVAADVEGKQPSETQFVSNNTVNITGTEAGKEINEPPHDKTNKIACAPSLISLRCPHEESLSP